MKCDISKTSLKDIKDIRNSSLRLVVLVSYSCNFDCRYCCVPRELRRKKDMPEEYLLKSVDFLLTSTKEDLQLHFFGAEPLFLPIKIYDNVLHYATEKSLELRKNLKLVVTSNGALLNKRWIQLFKEYGVRVEISLDGTPQSHNVNRPQRGYRDSYTMIIQNLPLIFESGIEVQVSMVITPQTAGCLPENFRHLVHLGFRKIFMMVANCVPWTEESIEALRRGLREVGRDYHRFLGEESVILLNLRDWIRPMRMNTELAVDVDGSIYSACVGYLARDPELKKRCTLANISSVQGSIDDYEHLRLTNLSAMEIVFKESNAYETLSSCIRTGNVMTEFVERLRKNLLESYHAR